MKTLKKTLAPGQNCFVEDFTNSDTLIKQMGFGLRKGLTMTRQTRTEIINRSFEAMEGCQEVIDGEIGVTVRFLAQIVYELAWCVWQIVTDERRASK